MQPLVHADNSTNVMIITDVTICCYMQTTGIFYFKYYLQYTAHVSQTDIQTGEKICASLFACVNLLKVWALAFLLYICLTVSFKWHSIDQGSHFPFCKWHFLHVNFATVIFDISDPPNTAVTHLSTGKPTEGSSVTLTCSVTDSRPQNVVKLVTWKKGSTVISTHSRYQLSDLDLTICSLDHTLDDGHYSCAAENDAGMGDFSATFHLLVNCKYNIEHLFTSI